MNFNTILKWIVVLVPLFGFGIWGMAMAWVLATHTIGAYFARQQLPGVIVMTFVAIALVVCVLLRVASLSF